MKAAVTSSGKRGPPGSVDNFVYPQGGRFRENGWEPVGGREQSNNGVLVGLGRVVGKSTIPLWRGNMSISNVILRGVSGAYLLQSGYGKLDMPVEAAAGIQGFAATGVPAMEKMDADTFGKFVAYSELGIGGALVAPMVPSRLAGLALGGFSAGLLAIYFRNPGMTKEDGLRPSEDGLSLSKDLFLAAIAGALVFAPTKKRKKAKKK